MPLLPLLFKILGRQLALAREFWIGQRSTVANCVVWLRLVAAKRRLVEVLVMRGAGSWWW